MFEKSALLEETKRVRGMLDKAQYPETYAALSDVFINEDTPFIIASKLMECDKPKDLPAFVIEYITALYEIEISEGNHHAMNNRQLHESILKNEHYAEMGQHIKAIRNERGLTVEKAAERLGVSTTSIKLFENGKSLRFENILRICRGYECTIAEIIPYEFLEYTSPLTTLIPIIGKRQIASMKAGLDRIERRYQAER